MAMCLALLKNHVDTEEFQVHFLGFVLLNGGE